MPARRQEILEVAFGAKSAYFNLYPGAAVQGALELILVTVDRLAGNVLATLSGDDCPRERR